MNAMRFDSGIRPEDHSAAREPHLATPTKCHLPYPAQLPPPWPSPARTRGSLRLHGLVPGGDFRLRSWHGETGHRAGGPAPRASNLRSPGQKTPEEMEHRWDRVRQWDPGCKQIHPLPPAGHGTHTPPAPGACNGGAEAASVSPPRLCSLAANYLLLQPVQECACMWPRVCARVPTGMCVHTHLCMCPHTGAYVSLWVRVYAGLCTYVCMCTRQSMRAHECVCVSICACMCVYTCQSMCAYERGRVHASACTCMPRRPCVCIRVCAHLCVCACPGLTLMRCRDLSGSSSWTQTATPALL